MKTIGRHLIAELYGCGEHTLDAVDEVERQMLEAADRIGATVLGHAFHRFRPRGVSGAVVIAESHLSIHTWPEAAYAAVDVFTCGPLDPRPALSHLAAVFEAREVRVQEIVRGAPEEALERILEPGDVEVTVV